MQKKVNKQMKKSDKRVIEVILYLEMKDRTYKTSLKKEKSVKRYIETSMSH